MRQILFIILFSATAAFAQDAKLKDWGSPWSQDDKIRQALVTGLFMLDWRQTQHIVKNPEHYYEENLILGKHPSMREVNRYWAIVIPLHAWVMTKLDSQTRKIVQRVFIVGEGINTRNNHVLFKDHERDGRAHFSIGLRFPL